MHRNESILRHGRQSVPHRMETFFTTGHHRMLRKEAMTDAEALPYR